MSLQTYLQYQMFKNATLVAFRFAMGREAGEVDHGQVDKTETLTVGLTIGLTAELL